MCLQKRFLFRNQPKVKYQKVLCSLMCEKTVSFWLHCRLAQFKRSNTNMFEECKDATRSEPERAKTRTGKRFSCERTVSDHVWCPKKQQNLAKDNRKQQPNVMCYNSKLLSPQSRKIVLSSDNNRQLKKVFCRFRDRDWLGRTETLPRYLVGLVVFVFFAVRGPEVLHHCCGSLHSQNNIWKRSLHHTY